MSRSECTANSVFSVIIGYATARMSGKGLGAFHDFAWLQMETDLQIGTFQASVALILRHFAY